MVPLLATNRRNAKHLYSSLPPDSNALRLNQYLVIAATHTGHCSRQQQNLKSPKNHHLLFITIISSSFTFSYTGRTVPSPVCASIPRRSLDVDCSLSLITLLLLSRFVDRFLRVNLRETFALCLVPTSCTF